jgi:hypothetical protein
VEAIPAARQNSRAFTNKEMNRHTLRSIAHIYVSFYDFVPRNQARYFKHP